MPTGDVVAREWASIQSADLNGDVDHREGALGIPAGGLRRLGVAWAAALGALAAPMLAGIGGPMIGVRLRADDGRKWAIAGSRNGLFVPTAFSGDGPIYCPEGLTDTAALAGLGLDAVGRPSCTGGRELVRAVARATARPMVIVSDADEPGRKGADLLASELAGDGRTVRIIYPPSGMKDIREFVKVGASASTIGFMARQAPMWSKAR